MAFKGGMPPPRLRGALRGDVDMEAGRWGSPPTRILRTQPRGEGRSGARGAGRGPGGGVRRVDGPALPAGTPPPAQLQQHFLLTPSASRCRNLTPRARLWAGIRPVPKRLLRGSQVLAEIGGCSHPGQPPVMQRSSSLPGSRRLFHFHFFKRGQRDETKTTWFSPKPLAAAVRTGRARRAGGWGWRCPRCRQRLLAAGARPSLLPLRRLQIGGEKKKG